MGPVTPVPPPNNSGNNIGNESPDRKDSSVIG